MDSKTFKVTNMSCNGCVSTVRAELEQVAGVVVVDISKSTQLVSIEWDTPASWPVIEKALVAIDYAPSEV